MNKLPSHFLFFLFIGQEFIISHLKKVEFLVNGFEECQDGLKTINDSTLLWLQTHVR